MTPTCKGQDFGEWAQGVTYTIADIWEAFEAGAREVANNVRELEDVPGAFMRVVRPDAKDISRAADAYCKLIHPLSVVPNPDKTS